MSQTESKPGRKTIPAAVPVLAATDPQSTEQLVAADQMAAMQVAYGQERDLANQLLGQIQMGRAISKFTDVVSLQKLKLIKENKTYRALSGQKGIDRQGNEIADVGTFDGFCRALGTSASKVDEDLANLDAFGEEALAQLSQAGAGYRELRQYRKLPEDQKQALIEVAKAGDKEGFVELAEEIIARHAKEKEALAAQVKQAKATLEAKDRVLVSNSEQITALAEQVEMNKHFKPRAGSEVRTAQEQLLLQELDNAGSAAYVKMTALFHAAYAALSGGGARECIQARARQAVEFLAQQIADMAEEYGIAIDMEARVTPTWLTQDALATLEARNANHAKSADTAAGDAAQS